MVLENSRTPLSFCKAPGLSSMGGGVVRALLAPDVLEGLGRHRGIAHSVGDAAVPKEVLEPASIHALACQRVTCAVAKHVDVDREGQFGGFPGSLDHPSDAHASKGLPTLVDENIGRLRAPALVAVVSVLPIRLSQGNGCCRCCP